MASRRLQKRIEAEAAEKLGKTAKKKEAPKKRATRKTKTTRTRKAKEAERKKIYWGVFSGTLKEEGRFAYDERDKAEERLAQLRARSTKKLYFIQPIKESLSAAAAADEASSLSDDLLDEENEAVLDDELEEVEDAELDDDFGDDSEEE